MGGMGMAGEVSRMRDRGRYEEMEGTGESGREHSTNRKLCRSYLPTRIHVCVCVLVAPFLLDVLRTHYA